MLRKFVVLCCLSLSVSLLPTSAYASGPLFGPRADYSTGFTPLTGSPQTAPNSGSVATGDFNGDGKMDVVAACNCSNSVSFFAGTGTGNLRSAVSTATPATGGLGQIVSGDFNEDGKLDLLAGSLTGSTMLLLGKGDGTFSTQTISAINSFLIVRVADLNGDGHLDVVYSLNGPLMPYIALGDGKGNFSVSAAPALTTQSSGNTYGLLIGLAIGDFNGDKKIDIVASYETAYTNNAAGYAVYIGEGDGTFARPAFYANANVDEFEGTLEVGDFDNDGKLDLLTSLPYWIIQIYHGNGDGTFQRTAAYNLNVLAPAFTLNPSATSTLPEAILPLDVNGDGKMDVIAADTENNYVFAQLNDYPGGYDTSPNDFNASGLGSPQHLAAADLNGDGKPDVIDFDRSNCGVSVFLSSPTAATATQTTLGLSSEFIPSITTPVTATVTVTGTGTAPPSGRVILSTSVGEVLVGSGTLDNTGKAVFPLDLTGLEDQGEYLLAAQYLGDTANSVSVIENTGVMINKGTDTRPIPVVTVTGNQTALPPGQAITVTATVTGATAGALTGKVQFVDETSPSGSSSVSVAGNAAIYTFTPTVGGVHNFYAYYTGDTKYQNSLDTFFNFTVQTKPTVAVVPAQFTLLAGGSTAAKVTVNGVAQTATGNVTLMDGSATLGTATLDASGDAMFTLSSLAVGMHSLTASYAGDANYLTSASAAVNVVVTGKEATQLQAASSTVPVLVGTAVPVSFTLSGGSGSLSPTGTVTLSDGTTTISQLTIPTGFTSSQGTLAATAQASGLSAGQHSLTLAYSGDANFAASTATVSVAVDDVTATLPTSSQTISSGGTATYTLTLAAVDGFNGTVTLTCSGLPAGYSCGNSTTSVTGSSITATVTVSPTKAALQMPDLSRRLGIAAASMLVLFCAGRRRAMQRLLLLVVGVALISLAGCSGGGGGTTTTTTTPPPTTTTPVTTSFTITATLTQGSSTTTHTIPASITIQ